MKKLIFIFCFCCIAASSFGQWKDLFNGKDMSGWTKKNGNAEYKISNNAIVGISQLNTPNTFLCTEATYGDFILEVEVKVEPGLNSGIQIRSISDPSIMNGRVHGYQVEIDPGTRAWSGGIYDEARNGWLYPMSVNPLGQTAFKNGQWNKYHIEAIGSSIKTWINGVPCAKLQDAQTARGLIALQVHGIKQEAQNGLTVQWRNIRIATDNLKEMAWPDTDIREVSYLVNQLSDNEKRKGWRLLWDGKTAAGWRRFNADIFPKEGWSIKDGTLTVIDSPKDSIHKGGDIITDAQFSNFELELDYKLTTGANSGLKYFVVEDRSSKAKAALGPEYQLLDDKVHPDAKAGVDGNRTTGSLYDLITSENLSEGSLDKRMNPPGKWNKVRIVSKDGHVEHWLNNLKIVEYDRYSQIFRNLVLKSKFSDHPDFGQAAAGHIVLQDHGDEVQFRSIKIREF
ncbi:MAG: DUF1080 domain-containing protein [Saprospiraceae bacterium]